MSKAVVIVNSDTSYLEVHTKALGYTVYNIDSYRYKNLDEINKPFYIEKFLKNIKNNHSTINLLYGSGLENKHNIYKILEDNVSIKGNTLDILTKSNDLYSYRNILQKCGFKLPLNKINLKIKNNNFLSKPNYSFGGYNINFSNEHKEGFYLQEFIPGPTYSASFFIHNTNFIFLGFNKLILLNSHEKHPFIHGGAVMYGKIKDSEKIILAIRKFCKASFFIGYNSIDFKIVDGNIIILDINPRITSTFKIYNDIHGNKLLQLQIDPSSNLIIDPTNTTKYVYGYAYIFGKEKFIYQNLIQNDNDFIDLPDNGEIIEKDDPIFTIYTSADSYEHLKDKLKKKISTARKHYNCYNIDI